MEIALSTYFLNMESFFSFSKDSLRQTDPIMSGLLQPPVKFCLWLVLQLFKANKTLLIMPSLSRSSDIVSLRVILSENWIVWLLSVNICSLLSSDFNFSLYLESSFASKIDSSNLPCINEALVFSLEYPLL